MERFSCAVRLTGLPAPGGTPSPMPLAAGELAPYAMLARRVGVVAIVPERAARSRRAWSSVGVELGVRGVRTLLERALRRMLGLSYVLLYMAPPETTEQRSEPAASPRALDFATRLAVVARSHTPRASAM